MIDVVLKRKKAVYPYLGASSTGVIVLFAKPRLGTVLRDSDCGYWGVGYYSWKWVESRFQPITGAVVILNVRC